jgi:Methyltransferase domain
MESTEGRTEGPQEEREQEAFAVTFPELHEAPLPQDAEFCLVELEGRTRRIRFHDYHEIYAIPGLYEHIFYDRLACQSPTLLSHLLAHEVRRAGRAMEELNVLDVGAGNGIMGECLGERGVNALVGVDILPEAARAVERDRPGLYDAYYAADLLELPHPVHAELEARPFNCLTLVAALGFGDIPPEAFTMAYNFVEDGGFVAFNLRDRFLEKGDPSGFERLITRMMERGWLEELIRVRFVHRLSISGEPLYYMGIIGRKRADIPGQRSAPRQDN